MSNVNDKNKRNDIANAQDEHYRGQIKQQEAKSDAASAEMRAIRDGTSTSSREYNQVRRDYHRAEANKTNLTRDKNNFDEAFRG
ncbi:hypothetical protein A7U60_g7383 [Sanghuangporus baumii]|uniref:Uncharacterized protein n=1 Tax=Sanghuangporus baumii TaxID=108892 RepID=A0A9Q5HTM7_SANBA|nr:hypothetical protein A7U60_g7383 [Sanghuangporus baumii]